MEAEIYQLNPLIKSPQNQDKTNKTNHGNSSCLYIEPSHISDVNLTQVMAQGIRLLKPRLPSPTNTGEKQPGKKSQQTTIAEEFTNPLKLLKIYPVSIDVMVCKTMLILGCWGPLIFRKGSPVVPYLKQMGHYDP